MADRSPVVPGAAHEADTDPDAVAPASCANCRHYAGFDAEKAAKAIATVGYAATGECRRFPTFVKRQPHDRCGEHHWSAR